jgi:hypothetical protein
VILILAPHGYEGARALVGELAPFAAAATSWLDFVAAPSSLHHPHFERSTITVGGRTVSVTDIRAVVNALPAVMPGELTVYDVAEREYQAAELHAWLTFFLTALPCLVLNRPSALSLAGPALSPLGWFHLAQKAGVPIAPTDLDSRAQAAATLAPSRAVEEATWVDGMTARTQAERHTAAVAHHAGVDYLTAWYDDKLRFTGAQSVPDLASRVTRGAIVQRLTKCTHPS